MGCISSLAKYIIFVFNLIIAIGALLLIAIGVSILVESKTLDGVLNYNSLGGFAVAIGVFIFIIAFLGCCGAIKENSCMLTTYAVILIIFFIVQLVLGVLAIMETRKNDGKFNTTVEESLRKVFDKHTNETETAFDIIQKKLQCCGVDGAEDYKSTEIPPSCCGLDEPETCLEPYTNGCSEAVIHLAMHYMKVIGGIAIGFGIIELVCAIFACIVRNRT